MNIVRITTELSLSAEAATDLARKPAMMSYVLRPWLRAYRMTVPEHIEVGAQASARFWVLGIIPAWKHHLTIRQLDSTQIYTSEHGGPVHIWNHRLTFDRIDDSHCRYTDEIEIDNGPRGTLTRLFIHLMFRHRHRRWHQIASILQ